MAIRCRAIVKRTDVGYYDFTVDSLEEIPCEIDNMGYDKVTWDLYPLDEEVTKVKLLDTNEEIIDFYELLDKPK